MSQVQVVTDVASMERLVRRWKDEGDSIALVPTMGFLHDGHKALMDRAATAAKRVVVSIFVNPLQFAKGEDFERYPRDTAHDLEFLTTSSVDAVFIPGVDDVYPRESGRVESVSAGDVGALFEGASRPGHFDGVLTVVRRLCDIVTPDVVVFGDKDAQQVFLVNSMVRDLALPLEIVSVDTVRDSDGLALSSRNSYLSPEERRTAACIPEALELAARQDSLSGALAAARAHLDSVAGVDIDYLSAVDPTTFLTLHPGSPLGEVLLITAVRVGKTRLLDNKRLVFPQ
jgi:pantoate--beta-alanine ligase